MKRFMNKKVVAVALTAGLVLGGGGVAFAYFTGNGSGSGSATTGSVSGSDFTFAGSTSGAALLPGGTSQLVTFTAHNGGSGSEYLGRVYVSVATDGSGNALDNSGSGDPVPILGCSASWYQLSESYVDVNAATAAGGTTDSLDAGTVSMPADSADNQDACQGHSIELDFSTTNPNI